MRSAKDRARSHIAYRLRIGAIQKPPRCKYCNALANLEAHHPDYGNPDRVEWVCRDCHAAMRRGLRLRGAALCGGLLLFAVLYGGCATLDTWAVDHPAVVDAVTTTVPPTVDGWSCLIPSPWREILIGLLGTGGIVWQTISKRNIKRKLSGG